MAKTEDISFGYLLNDVTLLIRKHFDRRAVKFGLTRAQWRAVKVLYHREGLRQTELAEFLEMEPIAVGRVIDRLQAAGFVERRPDPKDRRAWRCIRPNRRVALLMTWKLSDAACARMPPAISITTSYSRRWR
jgi:MarR family transcriptional regulator for hemolysin